MRSSRTTISGSITALATALSQAFPYDSPQHRWAMVVACIAGLLFAVFVGSDEPASRIHIRYAGILASTWALGLCGGCTLSAFQIGLTQTPFGSLHMTIGGGTIGQSKTQLQTNTLGTPTQFSTTISNSNLSATGVN
jgi:FtsH-binding integral membrane protein